MAETFLGIDLQADKACCVQLSSGLKGRTVNAALTVSFEPSASLQQKARAIGEAIPSAGVACRCISLSIPTREVLLRSLTFPFKSMAKIRKVAPFELDAQIPFALEKTVYSLRKLQAREGQNANRGKGHSIMAAVLQRSRYDEYMEAFTEADLTPQVVDIDGGGLDALAAELERKQSQRSLFLDLGPSRTTLLYRSEGRLKFVHTLSFHNEVEQLAKEIHNVLFSFRHVTEETLPQRLIMSGESAGDETITTSLSKMLGVPVRQLSQIQPLRLLDPTNTPTLDDEQMIALGMALRNTAPAAGFNFRGNVPSRSLHIDWKRHLPFAAASLVLILVAWLFSMGTEISLKQQRLDKLQSEITAVYERVVPEKKGDNKNIAPNTYPKIIMQRIDVLRNSSRFSGGGAEQTRGVTVSEVLRTLSKAVSEKFPLLIRELRINGGSIRIIARSDTFRTVDAIKGQLENIQLFSRVAVKGVRAAPDGKGVRFSMELDASDSSRQYDKGAAS
jgi:Tfp pilus assembly PilM family ATPase